MIFYCPHCWKELPDGEAFCPYCRKKISSWDVKTFTDKLLGALCHPEPTTQTRAVYILGERKSEEALGPLARLFRQSKNPFLKSEIAAAAGKIGGSEALAFVAAPRDLLATDIQELMHRSVASRFGTGERPDAPIQWLSDNGSIYTALDTIITAERLHLVPITTPSSTLPRPPPL